MGINKLDDFMILNHDEYTIEIMGDASIILEKYTLQLYLYKDGELTPAASSVLIRTLKNYYLITAAHVLIHNPKDSVVILDPGNAAITVSGESVLSEIEGNEASDRTDIAVIKLHRDLFSAIDNLGKEFYDITNYNLDNYSSEDFYILYGYPISKTKFDMPKKTIKTMPFKFLTMETKKKIKKIDRPWTLQIGFTKNKISRLNTNELNQAPNPVGLSGGGVWSFENIIYQKEAGPKMLLKAIVIEYEKDRSILVCTKINMIAHVLIHKFHEQLTNPLSLAKINIR